MRAATEHWNSGLSASLYVRSVSTCGTPNACVSHFMDKIHCAILLLFSFSISVCGIGVSFMFVIFVRMRWLGLDGILELLLRSGFVWVHNL